MSDLAVQTDLPVEAAIVVDRAVRHRARVFGAITFVLGAAACLMFGRADGDATFVLNPRGEDSLPDIVVPAGPTAIALGIAAMILGVLGATKIPPRRAVYVLAGGMVLFLAAMLVWATAGASTTLVGLFAGTLRRATPLALGALAGVLCERAGVINIAIEGMLLGGAFMGSFVASWLDGKWWGVLAGVLIGAVLGLALGSLSIRYTVDQVVGGTVINLFALGMTSYLAAAVLAEYPDLNTPPTFRPVGIPLLEDIPIIGPVVFDNTPLVYAMLVLVAVVTVVLFGTRFGLRLRSVGEHPSAADTVGIDVKRMRYIAVMLGGAVAGLGGTFFSLDSAGRFEENMTAGRGFIALAALIFGRWHPVGALGAALVFGFAEEFQGRLAALNSGIPSEALLTAPYVVTLIVVAGLVGKARAPAADGVPFTR